MSTSFVYHAMGLSGYEYVHQEFEGGKVTFRLRPKWRLLCCPVCKSKQVTRRGMAFRKLHSLPIGRKSMFVNAENARALPVLPMTCLMPGQVVVKPLHACQTDIIFRRDIFARIPFVICPENAFLQKLGASAPKPDAGKMGIEIPPTIPAQVFVADDLKL